MQRGRQRVNDPLLRLVTQQNRSAEFGKGEIGRTSDQIVRQPDNGLCLPLMADLRTAEHQYGLRAHGFDQRRQPGALLAVPEVDAQPDDPRTAKQQLLRDVVWPGLQRVLTKLGPVAQIAHIGKQITQRETAVDMAGVESGKNDVGHRGASSREQWARD